MPTQHSTTATEPIFVSVKEMARLLGISRNKAYGLLKRGLIDSRYLDGRRQVCLSSVHDFAAALPTEPAARSGP